MGIYAKVNGEWKSVDGGDAGLEGLGGWAEITDVSGSPKRYAYPDGDTDWVAFEWTAAGTFTTNGDKCLIEALLVSGGGGGFTDIGNAASVHEGIIHVPADSNPIDVTPGAAGIWDSNQMPIGRPSGIGDFISTGISQGIVKNPPPYTLGGAFQQLNAKDYQGVPTSWSGAVVSAPHASSITGNPETYAAAYPSSGTTTLTPSTTGYGDTKPTKASAGNGQPGVVIIRVPAANAAKVPSGSWVTRTAHYAAVDSGVVIDVFDAHTYGDGTVTPLPKTDLVECDQSVQVGWLFDGDGFMEPEPPAPTVFRFDFTKDFKVEGGINSWPMALRANFTDLDGQAFDPTGWATARLVFDGKDIMVTITATEQEASCWRFTFAEFVTEFDSSLRCEIEISQPAAVRVAKSTTG